VLCQTSTTFATFHRRLFTALYCTRNLCIEVTTLPDSRYLFKLPSSLTSLILVTYPSTLDGFISITNMSFVFLKHLFYPSTSPLWPSRRELPAAVDPPPVHGKSIPGQSLHNKKRIFTSIAKLTLQTRNVTRAGTCRFHR